eukprot:CAMPEP_0194085998 /NCGR_PEP_ID=MMETSP0149-20130528/19546_1 /TAXON_ID=122233 /ORGANISM="Chaetoceros debilis, Strain MM31A-1" /LENGTH=603 /DNA_ID=CAMNT_0038768993 /DNA_START=95 /DNA_END=1906 /DNA_ORIENTATION=+
MKGSLYIVALSTLAINTHVTTAFAPSVSKQSVTRLFSATAANDEVHDVIADKNPKLTALFPSLSVPLEKLGFSTPTPIQSASATRALSSENLLLIAPTGSGKTLAYLLPALQKAITTGSTVLVVAPTRELSVQLMRDATSILSNLNDDDDEDMEVLLAVKGVDIPSTEMLNKATILIGTPPQVVQVLTQVQGGLEFIAGDVLSSVILDEVDILLPNAPKRLRTALDGTDKDRKKKGNFKKSNTPQDERRRQEQKRKLNAAKRNGVEMSSSNKQIVGPTDTILKLIASRYSAGGDAVTPYQVIAGSATASRRTLDRLNKALYDAANEASGTVEVVWSGNVKSCRPDVVIGEEPVENAGDADDGGGGEQHTIRAVTVPQQVKHQYIAMSKDSASSPMAVLTAVAKAAKALQPQTALVFLCGEFGKSVMTQKAEPAKAKAVRVPSGRTQKNTQSRKKASLKNKKLAAAAASRAKNTPAGFSARQVCSALVKLGVDAMPLHVALGLELNAKDDDEDAEIPPFLVTFEGSARGLHIDNVDTVFLVGRPASAASYLHLAGRVGRASTTANGDVAICPGTVVSLCTVGSAKELTKWTKQVGGTELEELIL